MLINDEIAINIDVVKTTNFIVEYSFSKINALIKIVE
jgi:hypothetical protein